MKKPGIIKRFSVIIVFIIEVCNYTAVFAQTNQFRGVNWADTRDNFQSGVIYLSGLSSSDTYNSASVVADKILGQFVDLFGSNSVRLPINEATVSTYWGTYTGAIDVALTKGKVILCYWSEYSGAIPKDINAFWAMWQTVVDKYGDNPNMYFEVFNEPSGYNKTDLCNLYNSWLEKYPSFPQNRVILDGSGLAMNVPDVGSDSRFDNCLLAVHEYSFFGSTSSVNESDWENQLKAFVGNYADRTVCTEWGGPMSPGSKNGVFYDYMDYSEPPTNFFEAYIRGISNQLRNWQMGSFYWIGLRDNDWYSLTTKTGSGADITLSINNQSGLERVQYSWGDYSIAPELAFIQPTTTAFSSPATIPVDVEVSDADGTVAHIDFYLNDETTPMHEEWVAPYAWNLEITIPGTYQIKAIAYDNEENSTEEIVTITVNAPQAPYNGTPAVIPGTIQFENFDVGGNGFAYYDVDEGTNVPNAPDFRLDEDIDIEVCTDTNEGYNIGYAVSGEWMEYTVNVQKSGLYDIVIRAATDDAGKTVSLTVDTVSIATDVEIPNTSGWQAWENVLIEAVPLDAGEHILKFTIGANNYVNLNYMTFSLHNKPIQLHTGWNLIGCPIEGNTNIEDALSGIWDKVEVVKNMDVFYNSSQPGFLNTLNMLDWGMGYLVKVNADCELVW